MRREKGREDGRVEKGAVVEKAIGPTIAATAVVGVGKVATTSCSGQRSGISRPRRGAATMITRRLTRRRADATGDECPAKARDFAGSGSEVGFSGTSRAS